MDFEEIKKHIYDNRKMIFILIILFIFAMSIRSNLVRYEGNYLFEPDAYYHARLTEEIVQTGHIDAIDPNVYYQVEGGVKAQQPSIYHYVGAAFYTILSFGIWNKELFAFSAQILPILFGALISIGMYFLGKEVFNSKKVGLITGFMAAVTPAFAYRTMAGAQGDNAFGFLWMVLGFLFLVRALKTKELAKEDWINIILAGLMFAAMVFSWQMNLLIPVILIPSAIFMLIHISGTAKKKEMLKSEPFYFIIKMAVPLAIYTIASYFYGENWINNALSYASKASPFSNEITLIIGIICVLTFIGISFFIYNSNNETKKIVSYLVIIGLFVGLLAMLFMFATIPDFFYPGDSKNTLGAMVGEENTGFQFFGTKYNALIIFPWVALFALPLGLYFFRKKDSHVQIIFWFWTIITLFMAWYKLKFTFVFGLGIVTGAAITAYLVFELLKKFEVEKGIEAKTTLGAIFILLILGVGSASIFMPDYQPSANSSPYWTETMNWINENTDSEANFFNWWGEGHQLAFVTERNFSSDNRNQAQEQGNKLYAEFSITTDVDRGYEIASKEIGADYILLASDNFNAGATYEFYFANKIDNSLVQKYYEGIIRIIGCSPDGNDLICNGQKVPANVTLTTWHNTPNEFYNGADPIYYYTSQNQLVLLNQAMNNSNLAKVYFNSDETKNYYQEVFYYNGMKIFKVLK